MAEEVTSGYQSYINNITAKTGKTMDDFRALYAKKPTMRHGEIITWVKKEFGLGHGHANLVAHEILQPGPGKSDKLKLDELFNGTKAVWRKPYEQLFAKVSQFGEDVSADPTNSYISLLKHERKFAIVQPSSADSMHIGVKLKGVEPEGRLELSGTWNAMVTHRIRITSTEHIDDQVLAWIRQSYDAVN
ncbi:MAG TPA: DUF4287 domain-containing protein [Verrucomicrobiae bacterium]|nr:DUF4287 domain-containing protein [Verrucomicrobiae bacterium]